MQIANIPYQPYLPDRELPRIRQSQAASGSPAAQAASGARPQIDKSSKLYRVSQEFEAIFIKQMLNVMRKSVSKTGLMDGGMAEEIFEDMLYDEYAQKMAESGSFGIADMIYRQLTPNEAPNGAPNGVE
jgi:Rod binding domain-containing protein